MNETKLINFKKKQILEYNIKNKLNYIKDPSNDNVKYTRVVVRQYLSKNNQTVIQQEFKKVKYYYPFYIEMLFQVLHKIIIFSSINKIIVNKNLFKLFDQEILVKILEIIYVFLKKDKKKIRYIKLVNIINIIGKDRFNVLNLGGIKINKYKDSLIFLNK